jgi:hypothetical protein
MDARLTEIVEIIHHAGLPILDTAPLIQEWVKTWVRANDFGQVVQEFTVGRPNGGIAQAARVLCVPGKTEEARRKSIERSMKIAGISSEAKAEAKRLGLDDNQSALLAIANVTPEEQVAKAQERAARKRGRRHKQTITPDHAKADTAEGIPLDASEPKVPDGPKEDGADPHGDAHAQEEVEAQEQAGYDLLLAAWDAAPIAIRQRFVNEVVKTFQKPSFNV